MTLVLDASVALSWFLPDESSEEADHVLHRVAIEGALVPALWQLEVANVLIHKRVRGLVTEADSERVMSLLRSVPIRISDLGGASIPELVSAGHQHGLTSYDAEYLVLAQKAGAALATLDRKLADAARTSGVELVIQT